MISQQEVVRPFPALTTAQRYHLDVFGYVVIPNLLTPDEVGRMKEALYKLRAELQALPDPKTQNVRGAFLMINESHHAYMGAIAPALPALSEYATHPRVVGASEELLGGRARIVEVNAHINTKAPSWNMGDDGQPRFGFHRGLASGYGMHTKNGLYHSNFVKVLTNLTDLGPDDGGTTVIAGSHKIEADDADIIKAAYEDRSLIHQVVVPAGSGLLFTEALMHATGRITSDKERVIIISGYGEPYFPWILMDSHQPGYVLDPKFIATIPEPLRYLFVSKGYIQRAAQYRKLGDPVDPREITPIRW
ncbi:MAG: phytanoyl-CoA dioxygenase family protein [Planctomycetota bacterium]|nr:phytanoyl-CoA dioxygenase family protein [Planctomycetota bacterium]